jgi:hypothetical protein
LISRLLKIPEAAAQCATQKHTVFKSILFMNKTFAGELQMNALRVFHPLCKVPDFRKICLEDHEFPPKTFDTFVTEVQDLFKKSIETPGKEDWQ